MAEKQTEVMSDRQQGQARQDNPQSQETKASQTRQERQARPDQGRQENRMARRDRALLMSPFSLLHRFFNDDILGAFDIFGTGRGSLASQAGREASSQSSAVWAPAVDIFERG